MLIFALLLISFKTLAFEVLAPERLQAKIFNDYNQKIIVDSYKKLGVTAQMIFLSEEQINLRMKAGSFDALATKIDDSQLNAYALKVSPPLYVYAKYSVHIYGLKQKPTPHTKIHIGAIRGVLGHEKAIIQNRVRIKEVTYVTNYKEIYNLLVEDKVQGILVTESELLYAFLPKQIYSLRPIEKNIYQVALHHYLNKKHKILLPKISHLFRKLKSENQLDFKSHMQNQ